LKLFQNITIIFGTLFVLISAFIGKDNWEATNTQIDAREFFALDPNNPHAEPIELTGKIETQNYTFPTQNGEDYSKEAIGNAIFKNIRTGNDLVLGLLYERLAYLEFKDFNYSAARKAYEAALVLYTEGKQKLRAAELLAHLAHLEAKTENYASAKKYYEKSATLFGQLNAPVRSDYTLKIASRLPVGD